MINAIKIINLTKKYKDVVAVDHLNLTIKKGELFALLGVNGSGKTTTIKMLSCITRPDEGDAFINDKSIISNMFEVKKIIGVSPQETAIAPNLNVLENLELICGVHEFDKNKKKSKIKELVEQFDLSNVINKKASKLSGGWQRRLSIAMALISEPTVLMLDEPTLGLDVIARSDLWDIIRSLKDKVTIILTTHYMEEAEALADHIGIMKDGKLLITGTPNDIKLMTKKDKFEDAFISIIKGEVK